MGYTIKIKNEEIKSLINAEILDFPKYTTQILNLANQDAQGTVPKVVGQMSDLIQEFSGKKLSEWEQWYKARYPNAIQDATNKIVLMVDNLKKAINKIDRQLIEKWVEDLVIVKTFMGLKFQEAILKKISTKIGKPYRLANPDEEVKGIDGFIGKTPVSIKPDTYKVKRGLSEIIDYKIIYYIKKKDCIIIEFDL